MCHERSEFGLDKYPPLAEWRERNQQGNTFAQVTMTSMNTFTLRNYAIVADVSNKKIDIDTEDEVNEEIDSNEIIPVSTTSDSIGYHDAVQYFMQSRYTPQDILNKPSEGQLCGHKLNLQTNKN